MYYKAKVGHRHGVDFSMGYWTEKKQPILQKFCNSSSIIHTNF